MNVRELYAKLRTFEGKFTEKMSWIESNEKARMYELRGIHKELGQLQNENSKLTKENQELKKISLSDIEKQLRLLQSWKSFKEESEDDVLKRVRVLEDKVSVLPNMHEKLQATLQQKPQSARGQESPRSSLNMEGGANTRQAKKMRTLEREVSLIPNLQKDVDILNEWMETKNENEEEMKRGQEEILNNFHDKLDVIPKLQDDIEWLRDLMVSKLDDDEIYKRPEQSADVLNYKFQQLDEIDSKVTMMTGWMTSKDMRDMRQESGLKTHEAMIKDLIERTERTETKLDNKAQSITKVELAPSGLLVTGQKIKLDTCVGMLGTGGLVDRNLGCLTPRWDGEYVVGVIWAQHHDGEIYVYLKREGHDDDAANVGKTESEDDVCSVFEVIRLRQGERIWLEVERVSGDYATVDWCFFYCWLL